MLHRDKLFIGKYIPLATIGQEKRCSDHIMVVLTSEWCVVKTKDVEENILRVVKGDRLGE